MQSLVTTLADTGLCDAATNLERVAEAGDPQPAASASDMQGSLSACHQRKEDAPANGSGDSLADNDGEVNSGCHNEVQWCTMSPAHNQHALSITADRTASTDPLTPMLGSCRIAYSNRMCLLMTNGVRSAPGIASVVLLAHSSMAVCNHLPMSAPAQGLMCNSAHC